MAKKVRVDQSVLICRMVLRDRRSLEQAALVEKPMHAENLAVVCPAVYARIAVICIIKKTVVQGRAAPDSNRELAGPMNSARALRESRR